MAKRKKGVADAVTRDIERMGRDVSGNHLVSPEDSKLRALRDMIVSRKKAAKQITDAWAELWDDGLNYVFNNQLQGKKRQGGWPSVQMNLIWPAVKQEQAILAQRRPRVIAKPRKQGDGDKARFWKGALQFRYDKTLNMQSLTRRAILDGKIYGMYIAKIYPEEKARWDGEAKRWVYEPRVTLIHPKYFGMDPNAESLADALYCYCEYEVSVEQARALWPEFKETIDKALRNEEQDQRLSPTTPAGMLRASTETDSAPLSRDGHEGELVDLLVTARRRVAGTDPAPEGETRLEKVRITEFYFRDPATKPGKDEEPYSADDLLQSGALYAQDGYYYVADPEAPELAGREFKRGELLSEDAWPKRVLREYDEPKFPNGRVVFMVNDEILNPKDEDQRYDRSRWPFEIGVNHLLPHVPQGLNGVEMVRFMQDWVNVSASKLLNWLMYFADNETVIEDGAELKGKKLKASAGRLVRVKKLSGYRRDAAPALSPGIITVLQTMFRQAQDLAGIHDQAIGAQARGQATATEIATLQQSTQTGVGLQMLFMDEWTVRVMEQVAELDRMYMEPGDAVRIAGEEFIETVTEYTDEYADTEIDVELQVGTALPHDQERRKQDAERLKGMYPQNPVIDEYVLEAFDFPRKSDALQTQADYAQFQQWKAQMAAVAEAQQRGEVPVETPAGPGGAFPPPAATVPAQM